MSGSSVAGTRAGDPATRQAAAWFARLRADDVTSADRAAFEQWLRDDLEHRAAYEQFERFWTKTGGFAGERAVAQVVRSVQRPRRPLLWAAAAGVVLTAGAALVASRLLTSDGVHETRVGELNTMMLSDGSRVTLNTDTRLRVRFTERDRIVLLDHGQAYFKVAKDQARPFEVSTRNGTVRALGTEFEVYQQETQVLVTLVEGKVMVSETNGTDAPGENGARKVLQPGELIALKPGAPAEVRRASIEHSTAWMAGKLVFDDAPLEYAVAEANRYSRHKIAFGDDRLRTLRISGVFRTGEPEEFVHAISSYFPVRARAEDGGGYLLVPAR